MERFTNTTRAVSICQRLNNWKQSASARTVTVLQIIFALVFATAIIVSALLLKDESDTAMYLLVALWWIPFSFLSSRGKRGCED